MRQLVIFLAVVVSTGGMFAQSPVTFSHQPIECVSNACGRATINTKIDCAIPLRSVRVNFSNGAGPDYYLEMVHSGDWNFYAVLPAVMAGTPSISYRILAITEDGTEIAGPTFTVPVTELCEPKALTEEQTSYAMNVAVGLTNASQSGSPEGFSCAGIVKVIDSGEVMSDNAACEEVRLAKTDPCLMALFPDAVPAVAGFTTGRAFAYTAAGLAVGIGGAIIWDRFRDDSEPVSRSRP